MKISDDQNTITLDDGTLLVADDVRKYYGVNCASYCSMCALSGIKPLCSKAPCGFNDRNDMKSVIFIKEQKND